MCYASGEAFAAALIDNKNITSFNLSWNTLRTRAAAAIAKALNVNEIHTVHYQ